MSVNSHYHTWDSIKSQFLDNFLTTKLHFIDFEFGNISVPTPLINEIGVTTSFLSDPINLSTFHTLVACKDTVQSTIRIHGILYSDKYPSPSDGYALFRKYISQYSCDGIQIFVIKDEKVGGGDVQALAEILQNSSIEYTVITHHTLIQSILTKFDVQFDKKVLQNDTNNTYKHIKSAQRCLYHNTLESHFHCALADAGNTSLGVLSVLQHALPTLPLKNKMLIPDFTIPPFSFENTFVVVFTNYLGSHDTPFEIVMSSIHLTNNETTQKIMMEMKGTVFKCFVPQSVLDGKDKGSEVSTHLLEMCAGNVDLYNKNARKEIDAFVNANKNTFFVFLDTKQKNLPFDFHEIFGVCKTTFFESFLEHFVGVKKYNEMVFNDFYTKISEKTENVDVCDIHKSGKTSGECVLSKLNKFKYVVENIINDSENTKKLSIALKEWAIENEKKKAEKKEKLEKRINESQKYNKQHQKQTEKKEKGIEQ
ncbi:hypothetical protein EIN_432610 [Entamoeba invadens IP1]|uniref:Uncharacterized protein n=1 Tax=Entamoeba invadens IP1 TaxID=370355 RepID=A0A0A1UFW5_ENTIV|nr:hypothetical protein EIN_432610 [Entamoeba invadens IP1]ELP93709.1 hypothetical protein EIN_432610 [Entamoeba invadens IP1]|eukprot:XP_004260480.1 hypothetical protein EIN_432610 [Entamoeba invadens IP1]